jgi:hypothetical protein
LKPFHQTIHQSITAGPPPAHRQPTASPPPDHHQTLGDQSACHQASIRPSSSRHGSLTEAPIRPSTGHSQPIRRQLPHPEPRQYRQTIGGPPPGSRLGNRRPPPDRRQATARPPPDLTAGRQTTIRRLGGGIPPAPKPTQAIPRPLTANPKNVFHQK